MLNEFKSIFGCDVIMEIIIIVTLIILGIKILANIKGAKLIKYLETGDKLYKKEHFSEALVFYKSAIKICSVSFSAYDKMIRIYVFQGHFAEALSTCDTFIKKLPKNYVPYYTKGGVYEECGELEKALDCYNHAFDKDPKERDICLCRAAVLFRLHRYEESIAQYDMAISLGCEEGDVCGRKGTALIELSRYSEAEEYYKSIKEQYNNGYIFNGKIACAEFYQGKYAASKEIYDSILEQHNSEENGHFVNPLIQEDTDSIMEFLNKNNIKCDEFEKSDLSNNEKRENVLKSIAQNITSVVSDNENCDKETLKWAADRWMEILGCYLSNKEFESVICERSKALNYFNDEIDSEDISNNNKIKIACDEKAILIKVKLKIIGSYLLNGFYLILILLVCFYLYKGIQDNNTTHFDNTIEILTAEKYQKSLQYIREGEELLKASSYDAAIKAFDKAIDLYSSNVSIHVSKATALMSLNKYNNALEECNIALEMNEDYEEALICKGDILVLLNRHYEAINCYERALEINPENVGVANKKDKCEKLINDKIKN